MKQSFLFLFALLFSFSISAQDHEATLYFHDGTDISGYASLKLDKASFYGLPQDKILFRVSKDDEPDTWDQETITKIVFHDFDFPRTFEYIEIKFSNGNETCLFELITEGEVNLYADAMAAWNSKPKDPDQGSHVLPDEKHLKVKRKNETKLTSFNGNKKKIATYFNECPGVIEILTNNSVKAETLQEIVEYYNDLCIGYDPASSAKKQKTTGDTETEQEDGE